MSGQDFTATVVSGVTLVEWKDPLRPAGTLSIDDPGAPSRLNPMAGYPHKRWVGMIGTPIVIEATVDGYVAPVDYILHGRLFRAWFVERPPGTVIPIAGGISRSSRQTFTPLNTGHWCVGMWRQNGGGTIFLHVDVSEAS